MCLRNVCCLPTRLASQPTRHSATVSNKRDFRFSWRSLWPTLSVGTRRQVLWCRYERFGEWHCLGFQDRGHTSILKKEAVGSSEISVLIYQTKRRHIPKGRILQYSNYFYTAADYCVVCVCVCGVCVCQIIDGSLLLDICHIVLLNLNSNF